MTQRLAILCPGQGSQHPQMFDFARTALDLDTLMTQWSLDQKLGLPVQAALNDQDVLFANRIAQPLLVTCAAANWAAIKDAMPEPALVVGYSIGELSAYNIAGALPTEEAIRLAAVRATMMDECAQDMPQTLIAISGAPRHIVDETVARHGWFIAIETSNDSVIAGGAANSTTVVAQEIEALGGHITRLPVNIASHTPLMHAAVEPFMQALQRSSLRSTRVPVLSGTLAEKVCDREKAIATLAHQLEQTIHWKACMDTCAEAGITIALEIGPGSALSRMLQTQHPHILCRSIADFRTARGVTSWVARHFE